MEKLRINCERCQSVKLLAKNTDRFFEYLRDPLFSSIRNTPLFKNVDLIKIRSAIFRWLNHVLVMTNILHRIFIVEDKIWRTEFVRLFSKSWNMTNGFSRNRGLSTPLAAGNDNGRNLLFRSLSSTQINRHENNISSF